MKDKSSVKSIFLSTLALTIILTITTAAIVLTYNFTPQSSPTGVDGKKYPDSVYQEALPEETSFTKVDIPEMENVLDVVKTGSGQYLVTVASKGYSSKKIVSMVGIKDESVTALKIMESDETAGLGDKIKKPAFAENFVGKSGEFSLDGKNSTTKIDALVGATRSSRAMVNAVNLALEAAKEAQVQG